MSTPTLIQKIGVVAIWVAYLPIRAYYALKPREKPAPNAEHEPRQTPKE